jgi:peptide chain release factor subunit 1
MDSARFRQLVAAQGPFASVYFDDSHDTEDAATQLGIRWRDLRAELEKQGLGGTVVEGLERAILDAPPPVGPSGRALIAGSEGILLDEHLIRPAPATVVRVSDLPYIVPMVEHGDEHPVYAVVTVDHLGADVTVHRRGRTAAHTVEGGGYPVHKASSAETPGYGDPQQRTDEQARKNIRAVAESVTTLVDDDAVDIIFVVGEIRSRSDLLTELPERAALRAVALDVGARDSGPHDAELAQAIETELLKRRLEVMDTAAQQFSAELGRQSGLAAEGLDAVCSALRQGAVETLIIGDIGDATVVADNDTTVIAPNPEVLSEQGAAPSRTLRADEALPLAAVAVGAKVVRVDERIAPKDGVAAVLRYAPSLHQQ